MQKLVETLLRDCVVSNVRYYTAKVFDLPDRPGQVRRQEVYLRALGTLPKVVLADGSRRHVVVHTTEEKGSDVNLATDLVWDALTMEVEVALVVSNDFDLQRPIERVMSRGIEVITINPHRHRRQRPSLMSSKSINLRLWHLRKCQLPEQLLDTRGRPIHRPKDWA